MKTKAALQSLSDDMVETVRKKGGEISIVIQSQETLKWFFNMAGSSNFDFLDELASAASVKCLLFAMPEPPYKALELQYRMVPRQNIGHFPAFIYGDKYVIVAHIDSFSPPQLIVCQIPQAVRNYRNEFYDIWKTAQPISAINT